MKTFEACGLKRVLDIHVVVNHFSKGKVRIFKLFVSKYRNVTFFWDNPIRKVCCIIWDIGSSIYHDTILHF